MAQQPFFVPVLPLSRSSRRKPRVVLIIVRKIREAAFTEPVHLRHRVSNRKGSLGTKEPLPNEINALNSFAAKRREQDIGKLKSVLDAMDGSSAGIAMCHISGVANERRESRNGTFFQCLGQRENIKTRVPARHRPEPPLPTSLIAARPDTPSRWQELL